MNAINAQILIFQVSQWVGMGMWLVLISQTTMAKGNQSVDANRVAGINKMLQKSGVLRTWPDVRNPYYDRILKGTNNTRKAPARPAGQEHSLGEPDLASQNETQPMREDIPETKPTKPPLLPEQDGRRRRGVKIADHTESKYEATKEKMNKRVLATIEALNAVPSTVSTVTDYPRGLAEEVKDDWHKKGNDRWKGIVKKINHEGLEELRKETDPINPSWSVVGAMVMFTQYVTLGLESPLSAALDAVNDATFHMESDERMHAVAYSDDANPVRTTPDKEKPLSMKSPRGHVNFGKGTTAEGRVENYPLLHHATIDHVIDVDSRRIADCNAMAKQAVTQLGPPMGSSDTYRRTTRNAWGTIVSTGAKQLTNIGRFGLGLMSLGGQMSHVVSKAKGLLGAISSLRRKSAAVIQAESALTETVDPDDQGTGALRRGVLANAITNAACGTTKKLVNIADALREGRVPKELFSSTAELNATMEMVKEKLLKPIKMKFMMDDPNLLMDYRASGYIRETARKTPINEGDTTRFNKGSLGHAWVDDATDVALDAVPSAQSGNAEVKLGVKGNEYRKYAIHKSHAQGMRDNFFTTIQELVIKVQIPVTADQTKPWLQLKPERELYQIAGKAFILKGKYTIFHSTDVEEESLVVSMANTELKHCKQIKGRNLLACPSDRVKERHVCEEKMLNNLIDLDCLERFERWDEEKAYLSQIGRTTRFIAYIPEKEKLEIRCPNGGLQPWSPLTPTGYVEVQAQPFCVISLGHIRRVVITTMSGQRLIEPNRGKSVEKGVRELVDSKEISWETFSQEAASPIHTSGTLGSVLRGAQSLTPLGLREYIFLNPGQFIAIITGGSLIIFFTGITGILYCKMKRKCNKPLPEINLEVPTQCCSDRELGEMKRRLNRSEEQCRQMSKQLKEISQFRAAISNDSFRKYITTNWEATEAQAARQGRRPRRNEEPLDNIEVIPLV